MSGRDVSAWAMRLAGIVFVLASFAVDLPWYLVIAVAFALVVDGTRMFSRSVLTPEEPTP